MTHTREQSMLWLKQLPLIRLLALPNGAFQDKVQMSPYSHPHTVGWIPLGLHRTMQTSALALLALLFTCWCSRLIPFTMV